MSFTPSFWTAKSGFLTAWKNNAYFCIFKSYSLICECFKNSDTHIAAWKVIISTVNYSLFIPHPIKADKERNKDKSPQCHFEKIGIRANHTESCIFNSCQNWKNKIINGTDTANNSVCFKANTAQSIVYRPFPSGVRVTVKKYAALNFTWTFFYCGYIMSCFFREKSINTFFVKSKFQKNDCKS